MDFFGFGNRTGCGWLDFIRGIPGVQGRKNNYVYEDRNYFYEDSNYFYEDRKYVYEDSNYDYDDSNFEISEDEAHVYKLFNTTNLAEASGSLVSVAQYREMILIECCQIMKDNFADLSRCKNANGNTPLHLIAALPGVTHVCNTLVKYLLQAGVDPLAVNNDGRTFLHIIFGGFQAEDVANGALCFTNKRVGKTKWFVEDRFELLELLCQEISPTQTALFAKAQDKNGNTVLHEYALSTIIQQESTEEEKICNNLLKFGASLRIANHSGDVPLHYAYTPELFKVFLQTGAVCRARNDRDETPVLFILKVSADVAYAQTSAMAELADQGFVKTISGSIPVRKHALTLLENLKNILLQNKDAKESVWIPDIKGNVAIDLVLIAIRIGSYDLGGLSRVWDSLCSSLVQLLNEMLRNVTPSDMKRTTKNGQSFLHVLLDMGDNNKHTIVRETYILQSVKILLKHKVDVNAVDSQGRTPLDIAYKHQDKRPSLHKQCADLLIKHGGSEKDKRDISSSLSTAIQPSFLSRLFNLRIENETRKLRSCPPRHLNNAKRLTDPDAEVSVVEKYRYSSEVSIGSGAFSSIFVAIKDENVDSLSGAIECRAYALKRMEKAKMNPKEIKREITTLLSLSGKCENIIKCHEAVEDGNFQYLCLDLMDGDLHEFVTNNDVNQVLKSNPATSVQITKEIVNGLMFLHEQKFIHRDLKPGNILYTTDPTLHFKIADFGLTKNTSTSSMMTSTGGSGVAMAAGTRCWMAPEPVSMNSKQHTLQSDIFSLGLVLHYLHTLGNHPFANESEPAHVIERKIVKKPAKLDQSLHAEVVSFLQVLLTKDPLKRPPAAYLNQHPYLWSDRKKIEFLKAVGNQPEAINPAEHLSLELRLQNTSTGRNVRILSWDQRIGTLYKEMITA